MKNFRDLYLIGISFVAGVLFVVQCGGAAKSIAKAVAEALDINFTNSDTSLESADVQNALSELDARFPVVFDANDNPIGILTTSIPGGEGWEVWSPEHQAFLNVNPSDGAIIYDDSLQDKTSLYYESSDCTGDSFMMIADGADSFLKLVKNSDVYYVPDGHGRYLTGSNDGPPAEINSARDSTGTCSTDVAGAFEALKKATITEEDLQITLMEAKELSLPEYEGPLSFGKNTST